ncbi:MAG: hypothetical protein K9G26_11330 [Emcibacter sp.]|nr:hypothetical protein [Emcibacter sp.]
MTNITSFIFKACRYEPENGMAFLDYAYSSGQTFTETITFPKAKTTFTNDEQYVLNKLLKKMHLAAGISYYKAYCPPKIILENQKISRDEAEFFNKFYLLGLGEFSVENKLDLRTVIHFPALSTDKPTPVTLPLSKINVVPIGGGKDSLVSLEILRQAARPFRPIAINAGPPILDVIKSAHALDPILITRKIDPTLFHLNKQGAYNGHVPITGILSFIMAFASILYDYDTVIMSNEQSANEGNMVQNDIIINHQYSKSLEFEEDFSNFIKDHILKNFQYFSLLRPLSESGIAALFAKEPKYFRTFKSCNRNFHIDTNVRKYGWCCDCPKCRFVFLALAPFIDKTEMTHIFGQNMLDDVSQKEGFRELLGLKGHKPFECVGEIGECRMLLKSLSLIPYWQKDSIVADLSPEINENALSLQELKDISLTKFTAHNVPAEFERMLDDYIRS